MFPLPRLSLRFGARTGSVDVAGLKAQIAVFREQARRAKAPRERAEALTRAASLSAKFPNGMTSATGLYLRAMRADPTFGDAVRGISLLLRKERPELLEAVLWRRLSHTSWDAEGAAAAECAAEGLGMLYRSELRQRDRARVMQKLAARLRVRDSPQGFE